MKGNLKWGMMYIKANKKTKARVSIPSFFPPHMIMVSNKASWLEGTQVPIFINTDLSSLLGKENNS
jgi:hypothetical protein